jgi:hypothetical protein
MNTPRNGDEFLDEASVPPRQIVIAVGASIAGLLVHNLQEFPPSILLAPETLAPAAITVLVGVGLLRRPSTGVFVAAAVWAIIVIVVGGASVLPLLIWPFTPEQTVAHYAAHVVYAVAQLPLLWLAWRGFQATQPSN